MSDVATGTLLLRHDYFDTTRYFDENLLRHQDLQVLVDFTSKYKLKEVNEYLHCVDVSDVQNRPDIDKLIKYKKDFFESIDFVMKKLSKKERKCVFAMHKYELGYVCIKNKKIGLGIWYCLAIFESPKAFILAIKKTMLKIISILLK